MNAKTIFNSLRKILIFSLIFIAIWGIFVGAVNAADGSKLNLDWPKSPLNTELTENSSITILIQYIYEWIISLAGLTTFIILVYAGFRYLTSAGNVTQMKDAQDRIKSAVTGLILLLASVLILNTLNPQLTQLNPLKFGVESVMLSTPTIDIKDIKPEACEGVILYSGVNYTGTPRNLDVGETIPDPITVSSVVIKNGLCQLKLFQLKGFEENESYPAVRVSSDSPNIAASSPKGTTSFRSAELINLYTPSK